VTGIIRWSNSEQVGDRRGRDRQHTRRVLPRRRRNDQPLHSEPWRLIVNFSELLPLLFRHGTADYDASIGERAIARIKVACKLQPDLFPFHYFAPKECRYIFP